MSTNILAQTTATPTILYSGQLGTTANATIATVPAGSTWSVKSGLVSNILAQTVIFNLCVVPSGGTAGPTRQVVTNFYIAREDTISLADTLGGLQLKAGDFIAAWANQASALNLLITGVEAS